MRPLYLALFLLPQLCPAQKITREIEPGNHAVWLATDQFTLKAGELMLNFRTLNEGVYIYLYGLGGSIGPHDFAAFILTQDTVTAYSTGTQAGATAASTYGIIPLHEYVLAPGDLQKLAAGEVKKVVISNYSGFQYIDVPERNQDKLMTWSAALLKAMGN